MPPATLVVLRAEQPPSLPNRFAVDHDRPIKRNAGLVNRARPSQYDAELADAGRPGSITAPPAIAEPASQSAAVIPWPHRKPGRPRNPPRSLPRPCREASRRRRTSRRRSAGERHGTAGHPEPASQSAAVTPLAAPGSVTSPPHEPTPAGRGASRHRRPPHSSMRSAIPLMSDTLRRRHLTRRRSASRPEAAGSSAARSSRQGDQKRRSAWCGISRWREKTLFRRYL
jgi:hypothetical protein